MSDPWEEQLMCAIKCERCSASLDRNDLRILSVYDHKPVCMTCKKEEEAREDYAETSRHMIGTCMAETEVLYSDPNGYCYHHFYPFKC